VYFVATRQEKKNTCILLQQDKKKKNLACNIAQGRSGVTAPVFWGVKETFFQKKSFNVFKK
jgi:hypothetical protein